jgi:hypothetical protein
MVFSPAFLAISLCDLRTLAEIKHAGEEAVPLLAEFGSRP